MHEVVSYFDLKKSRVGEVTDLGSPVALKRLPVLVRSAGQSGDLDKVVGEDRLSGPDPGSFEGVDAGAVPAWAL
jgi:hypothetical protein